MNIMQQALQRAGLATDTDIKRVNLQHRELERKIRDARSALKKRSDELATCETAACAAADDLTRAKASLKSFTAGGASERVLDYWRDMVRQNSARNRQAAINLLRATAKTRAAQQLIDRLEHSR